MVRARDIVGKTIAGIDQQMARANTGETVWSIDAIRFSDGSVLRLRTTELPDEYATVGTYVQPPRAREEDNGAP